MARGQKPDFEVFVSQKNGDKNFYTKVGAAWNVSSDGISIKLTALPVDGSLVMFPLREETDRR